MQTDTASVLLEAIGYIRFLQSQIEVIFLLLPLFFQITMSQWWHAFKVTFHIHRSFNKLLLFKVLKILSFPTSTQALSLPYLGSGSGNIRHQQSVRYMYMLHSKQNHFILSFVLRHVTQFKLNQPYLLDMTCTQMWR